MSANSTLQVTQPLVAQIVSGYVKNNQVAVADMAAVINTVYQSLLSLGKAAEPATPHKPAVPIRQSVRPNYVVCLECGRRGHMLRAHIQAAHGLSPEQYELNGGSPKITPSRRQLTHSSDPLSQSRWD